MIAASASVPLRHVLSFPVAHRGAPSLLLHTPPRSSVFRSCTPLAVAFFDYLFYNRTAPSMRSCLSLLLITLGAIAYIITDREFQANGFAAYTWVMIWWFVLIFQLTCVRHTAYLCPEPTRVPHTCVPLTRVLPHTPHTRAGPYSCCPTCLPPRTRAASQSCPSPLIGGHVHRARFPASLLLPTVLRWQVPRDRHRARLIVDARAVYEHVLNYPRDARLLLCRSP